MNYLTTNIKHLLNDFSVFISKKNMAFKLQYLLFGIFSIQFILINSKNNQLVPFARTTKKSLHKIKVI